MSQGLPFRFVVAEHGRRGQPQWTSLQPKVSPLTRPVLIRPSLHKARPHRVIANISQKPPKPRWLLCS